MICRSNRSDTHNRAFSLVEVMAAAAILGLVSSSVIVIVSRCAVSGANSALQIQAFEVARENMEKLLASDSLEETAEYGESELYPGIEWETTVETFYEPITARMWVKGVCLARYRDFEDQEQTVELTHWLTDLTKEQLLKMMSGQDEEGLLAEQLIETVEDAAAYAGVGVEVIEQWIKNGMEVTDDGFFVKGNLDMYKAANGEPTPEDRQKQVRSKAELAAQQAKIDDMKAGAEQGAGAIDPKTGLTYEELEQMDFSQVYELMKNRKK